MSSAQNEPMQNPSAQNANPTPVGTEPAARAATSGHTVREDVVAREKNQFGGMQFFTAFFGWLTATGAAVLLTALVAGAGAAVGLGNQADPEQATQAAAENAATVGLIGAIALGIVVFVAVVLAIVGAIAGSQFNVLADLNSFPRISINEGDLALGGIITTIAIALVSLGGAILGGLAGMRYHRKVDKAGLGR
ncbi:hypothetical protein [Cryobacterium sp. SO1]|uniref:hypothetical protein n=1 Tax=Cryobacterium sp. SO1 TaxID=1897061 RepID=UPI001022A963|nr:hypothetical protein [Cryobacterium sp. SO1]RZI36529.1 hypothetical protein BJQ95_01057 [Cryobacterium sp. SO1]